jgi:FKBP-type peptidyl-prolyl cis-trans isomerase
MFFLAVVVAVGSSPKEVKVTKDGKVVKTIIRDGTGVSPQQDQEAVIRYTGYLPDGTVFDSSREPGEFHFKIGRGVIPGWSVGVASMKVGEVANFSIDYDYGYGERGYPPVVPAKSPLKFEIELVGVH